MLDFENSQIFKYFKEISEIPRVSGNTRGIADYLVSFADAHSLECERDTADNVIIKKPATDGYEGRPTVILQGHTDMVGAGDLDFDNEGIRLICQNNFLSADGTTLGGDNGVAVAYMLALLEGSDDIAHPALECVFTSNEEIGLLGAAALDCSRLRGRMMINLDSDEEGCFIAGCAGGLRIDLKLKEMKRLPLSQAYSLTLAGFKGGHSGADIHLGRLNAIRELAKALSSFGDTRICSFIGGDADNVIPSSASCIFSCSASITEIRNKLDEILQEIKKYEPSAAFELDINEGNFMAIDNEDSYDLLSLVCELPTGVFAMSREVEGSVETSDNIGIINVTKDNSIIILSVRSSVENEKHKLAKLIEMIAAKYRATSERRGEYPGWQYKSDSPLRDCLCRVYRKEYGKDAKVLTIHAGLECGIFADKLDGLDCISMGPDNFEIHTVNERLSIASFLRVYDFLIKVLKEI